MSASEFAEGLRHKIGVYTEAVFMHSIALGHGKTHQEAADAIMELFNIELAKYVEQAKVEELRWFLLQTEIDDGRTKVAYMNDLRQLVMQRLATLNNQTKEPESLKGEEHVQEEHHD